MQKREFTSFDIAAAIHELKQAILDSRVNNIYQPNNKTLILKLHKPDKPSPILILEAGKRIHLTSYTPEKPPTPPAFSMALRKYLRNSWLTNIEQHEFERVILLHFKTKTGKLRLILELFGEGNIILTNEENKILQALNYKRMRDRNILRGETFHHAPPSGKNPQKISREEMQEALRNFGDVEVVRALTRLLSIGGIYAEEVLLRTGINKKTHSNALEDSQIEAIYNCLQSLLSKVKSGKLEPCTVLDETDAFVDVAPIRLKRYEGFRHQPYNSFNEALDEYYSKTAVFEMAAATTETDALKQEADRLRRIIAEQEKALKEAEAKTQKYKRIGDTIYMHSNELQTLLDRFSMGKKAGKEWSEIVSEVLAEKRSGLKPSIFFESFDDRRLVVNLRVENLLFSMDLRKDLFANAAIFYERTKRARRKLEGALAALKESKKRLEETEAKIMEAEALQRVKPAEALEKLAKRKIKRKEWFEKFKWFVSSDGFLVAAGKDAVSNEVLIKKYTKPEDLVFHADVIGAPFVVVKTGGKKPSEQCLREAGEFAAAFSRGWREGFASIDVYWVKPDQLSKGGPSGEYVPKGGFVVRGERNWMRNVTLKMAIGVVAEESGEIKFIGGPIDAIKAKTKAYTTIVPGDKSGKELLRQILKALAEKIPKEIREKVVKVSVEEIREHIPYNKGRILEE
jgi:predicted ribosome quality control (RQC) complex YloA/Tae2 family protein